MESQRLFNWIQLMTAIAVIAGLGLVVWELQQTKELASAQFWNQLENTNIQNRLSIAGEDPGPSLYRVMTQSVSVTDYDYHVVDTIYSALIAQIGQSVSLRRNKLISEDGVETMISNRAYWFKCPYGRAWIDYLIENGLAAQLGPTNEYQRAYARLRELAEDSIGKNNVLRFQREVRNRMETELEQ